MASDLEELPPGWTPPFDSNDVPQVPGEALAQGSDAVTQDPCTLPWVPGLQANGSGAFEVTAETWLGSPLTVKTGNAFDAYLSELLDLVRNYNHWLYRLRRVKVEAAATPVCAPMPDPPGQMSAFGPDTAERTDREFTNAVNELDAKLADGFEGEDGAFSVVMDPVRVNDYIVSVRVLAGGNVAARGDDPTHPSSSHVSPSSQFSSRIP